MRFAKIIKKKQFNSSHSNKEIFLLKKKTLEKTKMITNGITNYTDLVNMVSSSHTAYPRGNGNIPPWMQYVTPMVDNIYVSATKFDIPELGLTTAKEIQHLTNIQCPVFAATSLAGMSGSKAGFQLSSRMQDIAVNNGISESIERVTNGKNSKFKGKQSIRERDANFLADSGMNAAKYLKKKKFSQRFDPISTLSLEARESKLGSPDLYRMPSCANKVAHAKATMQSGFRGKTIAGPLSLTNSGNPILTDPVFTNNKNVSPALLTEYLRQNGGSNALSTDPYALAPGAVNFMKQRMSGASIPRYGTAYMSGGGCNGSKCSSSAIGNRALKARESIGKQVANKRGSALTKTMYSKNRVNLMSNENAFDGYLNAIDKVGMPNYQSLLLARFLQNHMTKTPGRSLMAGRQRQGAYASMPALYPVAPVPYMPFGNLPNYIPIHSPDAAHGGFQNPFTNASCSAQSSGPAAQNLTIQNAMHAPATVNAIYNRSGLEKEIKKEYLRKNFSANVN